jgi:RNA polymerase sigma factor (sigma-70 family)
MPDAVSNVPGAVLEQFREGTRETFDEAFEALFHEHQRAVYGWVVRIVRDPAAAEDLTVETFWRIYRAHSRFDPARGFEAWARTIATRVALDWLRARRTETALVGDPPAQPCADPAISAEIRDKTRLALSRLPSSLRIAAVLAVVEGVPHKEIAAALQISVAAVKVRVHRALRLLRTDLEQWGIRP